MTRPRPPLFLERASYRRRRIMDGARILPMAGFVLVLLPVLWTRDGIAGEAIYLFGLWAVLIGVAGALSGPLRSALEQRDEGGPEIGPRQSLTPPPAAGDAPGADPAVTANTATPNGTRSPGTGLPQDDRERGA